LYPFSNSQQNIETIFSSINAGNALANDTIMNAMVDGLPFGGVSTSGLGSYHGKHSFTTFSRSQAVMIRIGRFDFQNCFRYITPPEKPDPVADSVVKALLLHPMHSDTFYRFKTMLWNPRVVQFATYVAIFFLGRWFASKF
jgi:hypothetical protein